MEQELLADVDVFVVRDFLSPSECARLIAEAEDIGFTDAPVTTSDGPVSMPEVRNNTRAMEDREDLAEWLWEKLRGVDLPWDEGYEPLRLNERIRFYRYDPGQYFAPHYDGFYQTPDGSQQSHYTVMIYLNDGFHGGETVLHEHDLDVEPEVGMALFFLHAQLHEGAELLAGRKYVLRTDLMYDHR